MDYTRYSKHAFDALPTGSAELVRRLAELGVDVRMELHATLAAKLKEIAAALNAVGHDLHETPSSEPGEIDYAQGEKPNPFYLCCDTTISAGYLGSSVCDASMEDQTKWEKEWTNCGQNAEPNQALEPTTLAVTIPAAQEVAPARVVAHL